MAALSWSTPFDEPIELPNGLLITLKDAATYITGLPKKESALPEWQTAIEVLMLVGDRGGDPMMPHIAMMKALHRHKPTAAPAPRRKRAKVYKIVR
jgi:hypothetical protein